MHLKDRSHVYHFILEDHARRSPEKIFLVTHDRSVTYASANALANQIGRGFQRLGIAKGDRVLIMMPSGIDYVLTWLGLCKIGALMVPVNEAYLGRMLQHQAADSAAALAVISPNFLQRWRDIAQSLPALSHVVLYSSDKRTPGEGDNWVYSNFEDLLHSDDSDLPPAVSYRDPMAVFYTSGTTGPSKGVLYSYAQAHATALQQSKLCEPNDIFYMCLPMFHVGLSHLIGIALIPGATVAIRSKFSVSQFWEDVEKFGVTMTLLMSTMPSYLMAAPHRDSDGSNSLVKVIMPPLIKNLDEFKMRFGIPNVATLFNMTEVSTPLCTDFNLRDYGSCGRPRPGVTARIVDEFDEPVPVGITGELILRSDNPWEFNLGYWRQPEKTAEAWRNQWLHTGDLFSQDQDGNFYFRDRLKDAIRRRGENISSYEIEREVDAHPSVLESAAVAVPSPFGEEEVKVVVAIRPGAALTPEDLITHLMLRLPSYMLPRFVEVCSTELPKTPTGKIRKNTLREAGSAGAWDRDALRS
jgi:crotonobetaine/carnitine-CoA ligase